MAQMTVAQIVGRFGTGGAARMAYNLALALRDRGGINSMAIAVRSAGAYSQRTDGIDILDLQAASSNPLRVGAALLRLRKIIRENNIEILHVHGHSTLPLCILATRGMSRPPRLVFTWHDSEPILENAMRWRDSLTLWSMKACESIYTPSREMADGLSVHPRVNRRVRVFRNGVARCPASRLLESTQPLLLWSARFTPTKDPLMVIRAAAKLKSEGLAFRVLLAGSAGPQTQWYLQEGKDLVKQLGVQDRIDMPGWIERGELLPLSASIGLQTSRTEGLSITLLEQMMAGLAVVGTDVGDTCEALIDNVTGLVIKPDDLDGLCNALRKLITDIPLRKRLGEAARKMAWDHFSLQSMADRAALDYGLSPSAAQDTEVEAVATPG